MRRAARVDGNQADIVQALRDAGAYVWVLGLPIDLLASYKGVSLLLEIKTDRKKKLTKLQEDFFKNWTGGPLCRVDSVEAALRILKMIDAKADII